MKKIYPLIVLVVVITLFTNMTAFASSSTSKINVIVNKKTVKYDVKPYLSNGEVMLPAKETAKALNSDYEWNKKNKTAWIHFKMMHIERVEGKKEFYIHRDADFSGIPETIKLTTPIKYSRGRVFIPGIKVLESMGMSVSWSSKNKTLTIKGDTTIPKDIPFAEITKADISKMKDVTNWYNKNYKKSGIHSIKRDGVWYVLVSAGRKPSGGFTMGINAVNYKSSTKAYVSAYVTSPSPDMMVTQVETYPHLLLKIKGQNKLIRFEGEVKKITTDPLPTFVAYEELTYDDIKDNSILLKWHNENHQKQGISYIRDGKYLYALIAAGERPTGGFTVHLDHIFYSALDTVTINANVTPPGDNVRVMMVITYPTMIIRIKSDTIKTVNGEVIDAISKEKWVTLDSTTVAKMELYNLEQVKLRDITDNEKNDIMKAFNEATIDQNSYIEIITGNVLKVTTTDGYIITFTSYGSQTNVIANIAKDGDVRTFHLMLLL